MLSGIKVGKKKTKIEASSIPESAGDRTRPDATSSRNAMVAEQMRQSLLNPQKQPPTSKPKSESEFDSRIFQQEARAKHANNFTPGVPTHSDHLSTLMIPPPTSNPGNESEMSILDLLKQEKVTTSQQVERSIYQQQKKRKNYDDDDDDIFQTHLYATNRNGDPNPTNTHNTPKSTKFQMTNRSDPQNHHHQKHAVVDTPCFWWIQSSNFATHRLLLPNNQQSDALERIVLVMAPPSQSVVFGEHFYIVPIEYTASYSTCTDPHTWEEIRSVQSKLRSMALAQQKGVLFFETNFGSGSNRHGTVGQARLEAVWVPLDLYDDAPLYFRSALMEQAQEESTKPNIIHINTMAKPLYHTIPKNFSYFYIEYHDATRPSRRESKRDTTTPPHNADVLLLMESPQRFPKTFGADTIASMMDLEPMRIRRHHRNMSHAQERQVVTQWLQRWNVR